MRLLRVAQLLPGSLLVLWQIGFQLMYGLLDAAIAADLGLSLSLQAWLGLAYLVPYAAMQWHAGRWIDRWGAERVLALAAVGCALGAGLFATASTAPAAFVGRLLAGTAASFAFPGVSQLLRLNSDGRQFSVAMALLESCIGFGSAAVALVLLWTPELSWRSISTFEACLVLFLAGWMAPDCRRAWRHAPRSHQPIHGLLRPCKGLIQWPVVIAAAGVYAWEAGLVFAFGGFWSLWLERQQMLSASEITISSLVLFLAVGLGTAVFGAMAANSRQRCRCLLIGTTTGGIILLCLLNTTVAQQGPFHLPAMLLFGLSTAVGGLAFGEAGLAAAPERVAQVIGLVNGLGCLAGGLFHILPTSLMLRPGVEINLALWFGLLALIGWLSSVGLWRYSRLGIRPGHRPG